jgi:chromosome segregation ATPase
MEGVVTRFKEREETLKRIQVFQMYLPFAQYNEAKREHDQLKEERGVLKENYTQAIAANEPYNHEKQRIVGVKAQAEQDRKRAHGEFDHATRKLAAVENDMDKLESSVDGVKRDLASLTKTERERERRLVKLRQDIRELEASLPDTAPQVDLTDIHAKLARSIGWCLRV